MATTAENQPGLYSALYDAMTEPKLIGDLIKHPEFIRQAARICYRIAGPAGSDDLLHEACLRVWDRVSQLNPNSIRNEREFLEWFSLLARRVHLSRGWASAAVSNCTEETAGWPDALAGVPPEEMDRFLTHADACPYHTRLLHAEDEKLRAIFRRARGLDSQGRILSGPELHNTIAEHKRRSQNWRAAFEQCRLFGHMGLFNGDKEIASCGKFYNFSIHISRNELDPAMGLQIRGVPGSNTDEGVLLGVYALAGLRHDGQENTLKLDNGYIVGLKVKQVSETTFDIFFRCVESETMEAERAVIEEPADDVVIEITDDECLDDSFDAALPLFPVDTPVPPASAGLWRLSPSRQAAATFVLMLLVAVPCLFLGKKWGQAIAREGSVAHSENSQPTPLPTPSPTINEHSNLRAAALPGLRDLFERQKKQWQEQVGAQAGAFTIVRRLGNQSARGVRGAARYEEAMPAVTLMAPWILREDPASRSRSESPQSAMDLTEELADAAVLDNTLSQLALDPDKKPVEKFVAGSGTAIEIEDIRSTPTRLRSFDRRDYSNRRSRMMSETASFHHLSADDWVGSDNNSVLHRATNDTLVRKINAALTSQYFRVEPEVEQNHATARLTVTWVASTESSGDMRFVTLNVYIHRGSEKNSIFKHSYKGVGGDWDAAYDNAFGKAFDDVVVWIKEDRVESLNASAGGIDDVDQLKETPKEELVGELDEW